MPALVDRRGELYGDLFAFEQAGRRAGKVLWRCFCLRCGDEATVSSTNLSKTQSCGCLQRDASAAAGRRSMRHGRTRTPEHLAWVKLRGRCTNPNDPKWADYGGRGIKVCPRWDPLQGGSFENFLANMGERPAWATGGIDRIDVDGDYEPGNCRWATRQQQRSNQRRCRPA